MKTPRSGEDKDFPYGGENFSSKEANPRNEFYLRLPLAENNRNGVGTDGKLYDPWGREIMVKRSFRKVGAGLFHMRPTRSQNRG